MGILKIKCFNCGSKYEVTPDCICPAHTMNTKHIYPYRCPHCLAEMSQQAWDQLVDAFWTFEEVNKDLRTDREGEIENCRLFQAEYETHYVPQEKFRI